MPSRQRGSTVNTKRFIPVALVAAAGLTIAACSSGGSTSTPHTSNTPSTSAPAQSPTQKYLSDLSAQGNADFNASSVSLLVGLGNGACSDLNNDNGQIDPVLADASSVVDSGGTDLTNNDIGVLIGVAVEDLCPQYVTTVKQQLQAQGFDNGTTTS